MTIRIVPILAVAIIIGPSLAYGAPACMTESEARAKFPKAHLIWLGTNHCWTFGVAPVHSRRPVLAADPVPSPRPVLAADPVPSPRPEPAAEPVPSPRPVLAAEPVPSPRPEPAAEPALSPRPVLAAEPVPSPRPEIVNSEVDAGAQCQYSPCE